MRFGCCIKDLDHLGMIEKIGFDYAEISAKDILIPLQGDQEWEENKRKIQQSCFPIEIANSFLGIGIIGEDLDYRVINNYLKNTFDRAKSIGIEIIGLGSGNARKIPENFPREKANDQLERFLVMTLEKAEEKDILIGLEPVNKQDTNFINYLEEAKQMIERTNNPYLKLTADFYHMCMGNEKPEKIKDVMDDLVHVHVAENLRRCPGQGDYNFGEFFKTLKEMKYDSRVSMECMWDDFRELNDALNFLHGLC